MAQLNGISPTPTFNGSTPKIGPAVVPINCDFTAAQSVSIDMRQLQNLQYVDNIQAIFLDNSQNAQILTVIVSTTNQAIRIPAFSQAYLPLLMSNNIVLTFQSAGNLVVPVYPLNFPVAPAVWQIPQLTGGAIAVSDAKLDAAIQNNLVQTQVTKTGSGSMTYPDWIGNLSAGATLTSATGSLLITGAPGYFVTGISVQVPGNVSAAAATDLTVSFTDSSAGVIWQADCFVPLAAITTTPGATVFNTPPGFIWNNKVAAAVPWALAGVGAVATQSRVNVSYGITPIVG